MLSNSQELKIFLKSENTEQDDTFNYMPVLSDIKNRWHNESSSGVKGTWPLAFDLHSTSDPSILQVQAEAQWPRDNGSLCSFQQSFSWTWSIIFPWHASQPCNLNLQWWRGTPNNEIPFKKPSTNEDWANIVQGWWAHSLFNLDSFPITLISAKIN